MVNPYAYCSLFSDIHLAAGFSFQQAASIRHPSNVLSIVPGDFRHIGKLDILVMSQAPGLPDIDLTLYSAPSFSTRKAIHISCWISHTSLQVHQIRLKFHHPHSRNQLSLMSTGI